MSCHPQPHRGMGQGVACPDGRRVFLIGGLLDRPDDEDAPGQTSRAVCLWDAHQDRWTGQPDLNAARYLQATLNLESGDLLVVGGLTEGERSRDNMSGLIPLASVERRRGDGCWTSAAPLPRPVAEPGATLLADGRVLVCGGYDDEVTSFATVYDPERDRWDATERMKHPRAGHQALLLIDGRVLVVGGCSSFDPVAIGSAELWDPERGTWSTVDGPRWPRLGHTLTRLEDGRVLVAGGSTGDDLLGAAEIWRPT